MAHTVTLGDHPDFVVLTYTQDLAADELLIDDELHLNEGRPIYLLVDISQMNSGLPDGFLDSLKHSYVVHPNLAHLAVFVTSTLLRIAANMVVKVTRRQGMLTIHATYEEAYQQLLEVKSEQTPKTVSQDVRD